MNGSAIDRAIMRKRSALRKSKTVDLLEQALEWLDDYGLRMAGSAGIADEIREHLEELAQTENKRNTP